MKLAWIRSCCDQYTAEWPPAPLVSTPNPSQMLLSRGGIFPRVDGSPLQDVPPGIVEQSRGRLRLLPRFVVVVLRRRPFVPAGVNPRGGIGGSCNEEVPLSYSAPGKLLFCSFREAGETASLVGYPDPITVCLCANHSRWPHLQTFSSFGRDQNTPGKRRQGEEAGAAGKLEEFRDIQWWNRGKNLLFKEITVSAT